ncbi:tRNA glutamyl-Q(34) synthetase GluQRS [Thiorhodococcus mannitoliphagus]|uniref:Glutamyl-Q tRNA(Asp) synthetase n=1 Tax=Thiorhodococcus mannitoliphagus TaxID=329406 RepID=A0A6P1E266_9GAMM|nr:tRNA glutamyl-Q(34) synthetase GluQRS [Thiorhodococcus mannitoliphagus]NEX21785.1 tRNA glutamyl-Q(34) synthetase GluQRS [Thiorhodococcus mannitoliphagus]
MAGRQPAAAPVYRGRFAPSPTGPLHFGSLLAAMASYADARACAGTWLVRMEDIDRPREVPGSAALILETLSALGFEWDAPVVFQQARTHAYSAALALLAENGQTYPCGCSRAEIARQGRTGLEGTVYPGTCRNGLPAGRQPRSVRIKTHSDPLSFADRIQGLQTQSVQESVGDFVLRRADGIHAYQLAVVVDDAWQAITHVVRGADLLLSTPRQIMLQQALGCPQPNYAHIPLMLDDQGRKLSKSLASAPVDAADPLPALRKAWDCLGQRSLGKVVSPAMFWKQAVEAWRIDRVPRRQHFEQAGVSAQRTADAEGSIDKLQQSHP